MKRVIVLFLIFALVLPGCGGQDPRFDRQIFAMDTVMSLQVWSREGEAVLDELQSSIQNMEARLSVTREGSLISRVNAGETVTLTDREADMIRCILEVNGRSGGALDPCLFPLVELWGFTTGMYRVPEQEEIDRALALSGAWRIRLEGESLQLETGSRMDLGAAAKGWAGQMCADRLAERGDVSCALLYLGGNIQTYGSKPDGTPWRVGVQDPFGDGMAAVISAKGTVSVVTSGGYQRFFEENGEKYWHIMDPETGYPARSGLASVTIVCRDGLLADCLSTALFVLGLEQGAEYWREYGDFEVVWITDDGSVYATEGLESSLSQCEFEVVRR